MNLMDQISGQDPRASIESLRRQTEALDAPGLLRWAVDRFGTAVTLASSLGAEDQVLTHMVASQSIPLRIFTLDTGRMFNESYELIARTREELGVTIHAYAPDATDVEEMVNTEGPNLFYRSVELRKRCCEVRKVRPLRRALAGMSAWITGLRRAQSSTRGETAMIEWDEANGLVKINPLASWSDDDVWSYIRDHRVPYNELHDRGFPSIGCAPCTRAVAPGADPRSGRWWWEDDAKRECGIHTGTPVQGADRADAAPKVRVARVDLQ